MGLVKEEVIKTLRSGEVLFSAACASTNRPFMVCDPESFEDQVWMFSSEEDMKPFLDTYTEKKYRLVKIRLEKKNLGSFYYHLRALGATAIVYQAGEEAMELSLDEVAPLPKLSPEDQKKLPPLNPSLQTCGLYFMQEMRRPLTPEEHAANGSKDMEEELLVNIRRSTYFMLFKADPNDPKRIGPLLVKGKDEKMYQPFFSDTFEMEGFLGKDKELRVAPIPFDKIPGVVPNPVEGIIVNPAGFNLTMKKDMVKKLIDAGQA